jgi:hypothetical protein
LPGILCLRLACFITFLSFVSLSCTTHTYLFLSAHSPLSPILSRFSFFFIRSFQAMLLGLWGRGALDHIVALMGALASAPLALVVPPLMHTALLDLEAADCDAAEAAEAARRSRDRTAGSGRGRRGAAELVGGAEGQPAAARGLRTAAAVEKGYGSEAQRPLGEAASARLRPPRGNGAVRNPLTDEIDHGDEADGGAEGGSSAEDSAEDSAEGSAEGSAEDSAAEEVQRPRSRAEQAGERRLDRMVRKRMVPKRLVLSHTQPFPLILLLVVTDYSCC